MTEELVVLDAFEGGPFRLDARDRTLEGAVAVRAAQACLPLLEGNALGLQLRLARPLPLTRPRLGRVVGTDDDFVRRHVAAIPRLRAQGLVSEAWASAFARGPFHEAGRTWLFTGLLVRAPAGLLLRVTHAGNRRAFDVGVDEVYAHGDDGLVPLVLGLDVPSKSVLQGEVATLHLVAPDLPFRTVPLAEAPAVGRAHAEFYDAAYFARKKAGAVTRKYRRLLSEELGDDTDARAELVTIDGPVGAIEARRLRLSMASPRPVEPSSGPAARVLRFGARLDFQVRWDGQTLSLDWDRPTLEHGAAGVERAFRELYGEAFATTHRGALLYLTKYFTPHPTGEPHFFVKPWSFVRTSPGLSSIVDGAARLGPFDVLRGVISTDRFHATPAVFRLHQPGTFSVRAGEPLADVLPVPRALLDLRVRPLPFAR